MFLYLHFSKSVYNVLERLIFIDRTMRGHGEGDVVWVHSYYTTILGGFFVHACVCTCREAKGQSHVSSSNALYVIFKAGPGACSPGSFLAFPHSYGNTRVSNTPSFLFG